MQSLHDELSGYVFGKAYNILRKKGLIMEPAKDIFRRSYTPLTEAQKVAIESIKTCAENLYDHLETLPDRYGALARTALEESVMWAVKSITL